MTLALRPTYSTPEPRYSTPFDVSPERLVCEAVRDLDCSTELLEKAPLRLIADAREALQSLYDRLGSLLRKTPAARSDAA